MERETVLRELDRSGVSVAEFCRRRGLAYSTVMAWRRLRRRAVRFVEIVPEVAGGVESVAVAPVPRGDGSGLGDGDGGLDVSRRQGGGRNGGETAAAGGSGEGSALRVEVCLPGGVTLRVFAPHGPQGTTGWQARRGAAEGGGA